MCFPFSWGKRETHKQNSQEISGKGRESPRTVPGKSRDNPVKFLFMCLLVYWFFPALRTRWSCDNTRRCSWTICIAICLSHFVLMDYDPGRHLQECFQGPGRKVPPGVLFGQFWAPASECAKECFLSVFWRFLGPKMPKSTQKALFGALRGRCPKSPKKHSGGHFPARALKALL